MKALLFLLFLSLSFETLAIEFDVENEINEVMAYGRNVEYDTDECLVYFQNPLPTACSSNTVAVIKTDKDIGDLMCSVALSSLVANKRVRVASHDQCSSTHGAPILRFLSIKK